MAGEIVKDLGKVTAYAYAKAAGYTGTEEQFQQVFDEFTRNAPGLLERLDDAVADAEAAQTAAETAVTNANTAKNAAEAAQAAAQQTAQDMDDSVQQITTNKNDISDLKESITTVIGKNKLNTDAAVDGYLNSNGTIHANPSGGDWKTTDFIDVSEATTIYGSALNANGTGRTKLGMFFLLNYNNEKEVVGSQIANANSPYTIAEGIKYVRFSYHSNNLFPMLTLNENELTPYEPYELYTRFVSSDYALKSECLLNKLSQLKWCVLGDSLTEKNSKAETAYYDYIAKDLNLSVYNLGVSGTGYARSDNKFSNRTLHADNAKFDFMTIFGSFNDAGAGIPIGTPTDSGNSTICGCINVAIDNFYTGKPFKPLGLITPCPWKTIPPDNEWGNQYADAIISIAKKRGIPYLDLFRSSGIRPWAGESYLAKFYTENGVTDDGVHPNSLGHKMFLYPQIKQFVLSLIQGI